MSKVWVDLPLVKNNTSQGPVLKCGTLHTLYLIENPQGTKIVFNKIGNILQSNLAKLYAICLWCQLLWPLCDVTRGEPTHFKHDDDETDDENGDKDDDDFLSWIFHWPSSDCSNRNNAALPFENRDQLYGA